MIYVFIRTRFGDLEWVVFVRSSCAILVDHLASTKLCLQEMAELGLTVSYSESRHQVRHQTAFFNYH
jgi:hypothetical protein